MMASIMSLSNVIISFFYKFCENSRRIKFHGLIDISGAQTGIFHYN